MRRRGRLFTLALILILLPARVLYGQQAGGVLTPIPVTTYLGNALATLPIGSGGCE